MIETSDGLLNFPQRKFKEPSSVSKCAVKIKETGPGGGLAGPASFIFTAHF